MGAPLISENVGSKARLKKLAGSSRFEIGPPQCNTELATGTTIFGCVSANFR
jgi:hypothetical protein